MITDSTIWLNKLFSSFIGNSDIKIVFEDKKELKSSKKVLNLSIHPLRFGDDIFFNFETNDDFLRKKLRNYEVNYDVFYVYANILKASYLKSIKEDIYHKNSLLLVGQTEKDKVVFNGNRYLSLIDYIDEIKELSKNYDYVYFKPHPYAKNNRYILKKFRKEFKNIKIIYDNIYHLLSSDNISCVVGLNSSVLYEAEYFAKKVKFLYRPYFNFDNNDIGVYGDYWSSNFWSDILEVEDIGISLPFISNRLRIAINDFWGYNEISSEIILKDILKGKIKYLIKRYIS
jgi:hypothetical protein